MYERAEKLYKAAELLLDVCKEMQNEARKFFKEDQIIAFAKEFCTVKLGTSRRAGHTTLINLLLKRKFPKSLVLFPNNGLAKNYKIHYDENDHQAVFSTERSNQDKWRGIDELNAVIIDCATFVPKQRMKKIYKSICAEKKRFEKEFYFILLE